MTRLVGSGTTTRLDTLGLGNIPQFGTHKFDPLVNGFLFSRQIEQCSDATLVTYERRIRKFLQAVRKTDILTVTRHDVKLYLYGLQQQVRDGTISPFYADSCYRTIHVLFSYLKEEGDIPESPMTGIKRGKLPTYTGKPFISDEDYRKLLAHCGTGFVGARNRAWFTLLWTTGARFSEIANLTISDIDWKDWTMRLFGKGRKERHVPFICKKKWLIPEDRG
ncbi:MAG: tyrosine-type recombinase/integrase, partial [Dehalococcoidales bacterium]|nr:tyrosine-type recombinase/integrase [Dehalococcoidales bacterium]